MFERYCNMARNKSTQRMQCSECSQLYVCTLYVWHCYNSIRRHYLFLKLPSFHPSAPFGVAVAQLPNYYHYMSKRNVHTQRSAVQRYNNCTLCNNFKINLKYQPRTSWKRNLRTKHTKKCNLETYTFLNWATYVTSTFHAVLPNKTSHVAQYITKKTAIQKVAHYKTNRSIILFHPFKQNLKHHKWTHQQKGTFTNKKSNIKV